MARNYAAVDEVMYHVGFCADELRGARVAVLPGDPGRVEPLARALCDEGGFCRKLAEHREYTSWLTEAGGADVLVCSTGMGGPSVAICLEELARMGVTHVIRVGTTGTIQQHIALGDIIINKAAARLDGTSHHYAPGTFPAVASFRLTALLRQAALKAGVPHHVGISVSSDTFWPGQERYDSFTGYVRKSLRDMLGEWQALGALNYEMETSALFVTAQALGLKAGSVCGVVAKRTESESVAPPEIYQSALVNLTKTVRLALLELAETV